jgi:hypothetical protein
MVDPTPAMNALKRRQDDAKRKSTAKKIRESILSQAASELLEARNANGGRLPYKKMGEVIQALSENGVKVTRDCLNKHMSKQATRLSFPVSDVNGVTDNSTEVSSLHGMDGAETIPPATINDGRTVGQPIASLEVAQISAHQGPPPRKRRRRGSEVPKYKLPSRRKHFADGTLKPADYRSAIEALDKANAERKSFLTEVQAKQQNVENIQQELAESKQELSLAQAKLQEFEEDAVKAAKEDLIEVELAMDLPWSRNYHQLVAFKEKHGHLHVPTRCPEDKELDSLCTWVARQRARRKKGLEGRIKPDKPYQLELLDRLGLEWTVRDNKWDEHYANLQKFKEHNGHCLVPQHYVDKKLAVWVGFLRQEMKVLKADGSLRYLNDERIAKLNQLGFVWNGKFIYNAIFKSSRCNLFTKSSSFLLINYFPLISIHSL